MMVGDDGRSLLLIITTSTHRIHYSTNDIHTRFSQHGTSPSFSCRRKEHRRPLMLRGGQAFPYYVQLLLVLTNIFIAAMIQGLLRTKVSLERAWHSL